MAAVGPQRVISSCATSESAWHSWLPKSDVFSCLLKDLLAPSERLVVVAPHPDDDVLACGGLMAMHQAQSGEVMVISVTDGEASHADSTWWQAPVLAATRHQELLAGLQQLGVGHMAVHRLALPDGAVAVRVDRLELALTALLKRTDVVVTTWQLDGHPDHEATAEVATRVCEQIGCRLLQAPVWMWHWAKIEDPLVPWQCLYRLPLAPHIVVQKQAALAAHASQLDASSRPGGAVLDAAIVARAMRTDEYFFSWLRSGHAAQR